MFAGVVVVGRNSVEPHIERSEAKRSEHLPSSASLHPEMLAWFAPPASANRARRSLAPPQRLMDHSGAIVWFPSYLEMTSENRYGDNSRIARPRRNSRTEQSLTVYKFSRGNDQSLLTTAATRRLSRA